MSSGYNVFAKALGPADIGRESVAAGIISEDQQILIRRILLNIVYFAAFIVALLPGI